MSENSGYGVSFGTVRITDLDFADDAEFRATEVLSEAVYSPCEAESPEPRVSWMKTKVQASGDIPDARR